ncbi:MAG: hypothetical protein EPO02_04030 [Nitrospirae bacterium]|nr:MAG: hypothetical protein EPO02_04030 [Nitrospirota bacterium]
MKAYSKVLAVGAALLFVAAVAGTALAIEAFSERFEEDFSQPKTILARVIIVDPYEDAVWVNWVWKGVRNSGEIDQFWAMMLPGKNMRVFASGNDLAMLKSKARSAPGPAAAASVAPTTKGDVVEMTVQEVEQNKRMATNVKDSDDKAWVGVVAGGSNATFKGQPTMKGQSAFPELKDACGVVKGKPGVPTDVLGADLPGGSTKYGKHVVFKDRVGCVAGPPADPAPAAAPAAK